MIYSGHGNAQQPGGRAARPSKDPYGGGSGEPKKKRKSSDKVSIKYSKTWILKYFSFS